MKFRPPVFIEKYLEHEQGLHKSLIGYSRIIIVLLLIIGLMVIFAWQFNINYIKRPISGLAAMNPITAIGFILLALSFLFTVSSSTSFRIIGYCLSGLIIIISCARFAGMFFDLSSQVDQIWFYNEIRNDGLENLSSRMSPNTAVNFLLASFVLIVLRRRDGVTYVYQSMSLIIIVIALFSILGYIYDVKEFYGLPAYLPMSVHAAVGFFLFGIAILFYSGESGFMKELTSSYSGGVIGRILIPLAIIIPILLGFIRVYLNWNYSFSIEFGAAILILALIIVLVLLIWFVIYSLNEKDKQRKLAEGQVRLAYTLLHSSLESYQDVLVFSIDKDFKYLNFNRAFKEATYHAYGTTVEVGLCMLDSITLEQEIQTVKLNCQKALAGESHTTIEAYGALVRNFYETRYHPIKNEEGEVIGVTVLAANVTERIESEQEIAELNKELESFSYTVAHDLRAPLRIIDGYSSILIEDYYKDLDKESQRMLQVISGNARKMGQLIDDLLNFSKLGRLPVSKSEVNMGKLIKVVVEEQIRISGRKNIQIKYGNLECLYCDGVLMQQVFANLISNAIKYSGEKEISIIEINSVRNENTVTYSVKDNGAGFDMQYADKLFGVFQRLHKATEFEGTGVGLAIVQRIISKHGGKVWAESEIGKGANFYFSLPPLKHSE